MEEVIVIDDESSEEDLQTGYQLTITGQPLAMPRPRGFGGRVFNTRQREMKAFAARFKEKLPHSSHSPLFPQHIPISLTIWFLMSRPLAHFVNRNRLGPLRSSALDSGRFPVMIPDIDNLAKFVLDSLKGVAYSDDSQVVKLEVYRMRDDNEACLGSTVIHLRRHMKCHSDAPPADYTQWV